MTAQSLLSSQREIVASRRGDRDWIMMKKSDLTTTHDLYIYDEIGYWGSDADTIARSIAQLQVDTIRVYVNSPGGDAFAGIAIYNALRRHSARVIVTIDGLAASIASVIAMAGDEIVMSRGSEMMIHSPWAWSSGDADGHRRTATTLEKLGGDLAGIYQARAGSGTDWAQAMATETWYTAAEAVAAGLADRTDDDPTPDDAKARFAAWYSARASGHAPRHDPRSYEPPVPPTASHVPPATPEPGHPDHEEDTMSDTLTARLIERLGLPADADTSDDTILAAVDEVLAEQADPTPAPQVAVPEGLALIDSDQLAQLQAAAQEITALRAQRDTERREALVDAAVQDGRIPPARRDHWLAQLAADETGMAPVLASLPAVVPLAEIGHAGDMAADEYEKYYPTQEH